MIYTTSSGEIIGLNKNGRSLIGGQRCDPLCLFAIIPRLFPLYYPTNIGEEEAVSAFMTQNYTTKYRRTGTFDCFMFMMLAEYSIDLGRVHGSRAHERSKKFQKLSQMLWARVRKHFKGRRHYPRMAAIMDDAFSKCNSLIAATPRSILKASAYVECHRYQHDREIWEICLESVSSLDRKTQKFFKYFAEGRKSGLFDIVRISPDTLVTLCSFS